MRRLIIKWIDKFPVYDPRWPDDKQAAWLRMYRFIYKAIMRELRQ